MQSGLKLEKIIRWLMKLCNFYSYHDVSRQIPVVWRQIVITCQRVFAPEERRVNGRGSKSGMAPKVPCVYNMIAPKRVYLTEQQGFSRLVFILPSTSYKHGAPSEQYNLIKCVQTIGQMLDRHIET